LLLLGMSAARGPLAVFPAPHAQRATTLRAILVDNGVAPWERGPDLDVELVDYMVESTPELLVVAHSPTTGDPSAFPDTLGISVLDRAANTWRHAFLARTVVVTGGGGAVDLIAVGSVVGIHHTDTHIYLDTHVTPSAGVLLVLDRELALETALYGWLLLPLPDGAALYHRSMVHFAPTHAAEAWLYTADRGDRLLYPARPYDQVRSDYIDSVRALYESLGEDWFRNNNHPMDPERFDSAIDRDVTLGADGNSVTLRVRFGGGTGPAATPVVDVRVECTDIFAPMPRCREQRVGER
jgi:hypothetical protein